MSSFLYLALGFLCSASIVFVGWLWAPEGLNSGLVMPNIKYSGALLIFALSPIWLSLSLGRDDSRKLEQSSFLRANLSFMLALNLVLVALEFLFLVWLPGIGYTSETFRYFFEIYVVLALFQHIFLLVVWLGAAQVTAVGDEFITAGAVGIGRKENLSERVETTASVLLQKTNNDPLVKKQVDNLLEEIRMLPRFTNQDGFSKALKLINGWSETQLKNFSSFAPNLTDSQATLDVFINETKLVCKSISKIQN
jgi:hypothetical protein